MRKPTLPAYAAFLLAICLAFAGSAGASPPPPPEQAAELIETTFDQAVGALKDHREELAAEPRVAKQLMEEVLGPHIDFQLLSRLVLGRHWRAATPEQRQRFVAAFSNSLMETYAAVLSEQIDRIVALLELSENLMELKPVRPSEDPRRVTVRSLMRVGDMPITIDYRLHARGDEWKVYDIVIEGISFAASRRNEIGGLLERQSLDQLIAQLENGATSRR